MPTFTTKPVPMAPKDRWSVWLLAQRMAAKYATFDHTLLQGYAEALYNCYTTRSSKLNLMNAD